MRFISTPLLPLVSVPLVLGLVVPSARSPTLIVSGFSAFVSTNPAIPSFVSFRAVDPRPESLADTTCTLTGAGEGIYLDNWWHCDTNVDMAFWLGEDFLALWRPWLSDPKDPRSLVIGTTDKQNPYWSGARIGSCANFTKTTAGTYYTRTADWYFPITTQVA